MRAKKVWLESKKNLALQKVIKVIETIRKCIEI